MRRGSDNMRTRSGGTHNRLARPRPVEKPEVSEDEKPEATRDERPETPAAEAPDTGGAAPAGIDVNENVDLDGDGRIGSWDASSSSEPIDTATSSLEDAPTWHADDAPTDAAPEPDDAASEPDGIDDRTVTVVYSPAQDELIDVPPTEDAGDIAISSLLGHDFRVDQTVGDAATLAADADDVKDAGIIEAVNEAVPDEVPVRELFESGDATITSGNITDEMSAAGIAPVDEMPSDIGVFVREERTEPPDDTGYGETVLQAQKEMAQDPGIEPPAAHQEDAGDADADEPDTGEAEHEKTGPEGSEQDAGHDAADGRGDEAAHVDEAHSDDAACAGTAGDADDGVADNGVIGDADDGDSASEDDGRPAEGAGGVDGTDGMMPGDEPLPVTDARVRALADAAAAERPEDVRVREDNVKSTRIFQRVRPMEAVSVALSSVALAVSMYGAHRMGVALDQLNQGRQERQAQTEQRRQEPADSDAGDDAESRPKFTVSPFINAKRSDDGSGEVEIGFSNTSSDGTPQQGTLTVEINGKLTEVVETGTVYPGTLVDMCRAEKLPDPGVYDGMFSVQACDAEGNPVGAQFSSQVTLTVK